MSSVVKQLLGTETIQALRARGVASAICGLSANDLDGPFVNAGADMFMAKPLPVENRELINLLFKILDSTGNHSNAKTMVRNPIPKASYPPKKKESSTVGSIGSPGEQASLLPKHLSVLVLDDNEKLRQLFVRSLRRVAPGWSIREVHDGEAAMKAAEEKAFDLIFFDQFMPNAHNAKPMLGTEVAHSLRAKGVKSIMCGLSAMDCQKAFLEAGADCFHVKPFPCEKDALVTELVKILGLDDHTESETTDVSNPRVCLGVAEKKKSSSTEFFGTDSSAESDLPAVLSVLYVDDSPSLRKMFARSLERAAAGWKIQVVENGEAALQLVDIGFQYDIIFLDQHMNTEMLGSETAKLLRDKGVTSVVCGLSGDDIASTFTDAGADCFMMKPFPCEKKQLRQELKRILAAR